MAGIPVTGVQSIRGDPTGIDYLNKALRHELTAVNEYGYTAACSTIGATRHSPEVA